MSFQNDINAPVAMTGAFFFLKFGISTTDMMRKLFPTLFSMLLLLLSCKKEAAISPTESNVSTENDHGICTNACLNTNHNLYDKVFFAKGKTWLWGGENDNWHFDISNINIDLSGLKFGLGRELFQALMEPQFQPISTIQPDFFKSTDKFIVIYSPNETKAFPIDLMIAHEVVNDVINGEPIMVGYCVLADFAEVYSRKYCGQVFTFAVSGYTYSQEEIWDGKDGFVLWDRDTESLWWPLNNHAVSGRMIEQPFNKDIGDLTWKMQTWSQIKDKASIKVLKYNQKMEPPLDYPRIDPASVCN